MSNIFDPGKNTALNEYIRLTELADLEIDYLGLDDLFRDLSELAASITGTKMSQINIIDRATQWSIGNFGIQAEQTPREETICGEYAIFEDNYFEVPDLSTDVRFAKKSFVTGGLNLSYYLGVPIKTSSGHNIGVLCVLDTEPKELSPAKIRQLQLLSDIVFQRLAALKALRKTQEALKKALNKQTKLAHDIRGPIGGIAGLCEILKEEIGSGTLEESQEMITMMKDAAHSVIDLASNILTTENDDDTLLDLNRLKLKLERLYLPQAIKKNIELSISISPNIQSPMLSMNKMVQIIGNLVTNAIKYTDQDGFVSVAFKKGTHLGNDRFMVVVKDNGVGMDETVRNSVLGGWNGSVDGTAGEDGFGIGLMLVNSLVAQLNGEVLIESELNKGTQFTVILPYFE